MNIQEGNATNSVLKVTDIRMKDTHQSLHDSRIAIVKKNQKNSLSKQP